MTNKDSKTKKVRKAPLSIRVEPEIREAMEQWAKDRKLTVGWVAERVIELGWPLFQKRGIENRLAS